MPPSRKRTAFSRVVSFAVAISVVLTLFCCFLKLQHWSGNTFATEERYGRTPGYIFVNTVLRTINLEYGEYRGYSQFKDFNNKRRNLKSHKRCSLSECFNFDKCLDGFYVYVYPILKEELISPMYSKMLEIITSSFYFTDDPRKACLFVLSLDTLDRDVLSSNFVRHMNKKISSLDNWNNGENHIVFNMFSGSWPAYTDELSFDFGKAMIIKASFSQKTIRQNFDVSFLLLPHNHPLKTTKYSNVTLQQSTIEKNFDLFPVRRKYLLVFKGKRYLYGIGSRSRNILHVLNNNKDIVLLTTCRHGKGWENYKDDRCDNDNINYDRYDYVDLMANSTFCLVPRGRRLGSFRFLEAMRYGCIPVLVSNAWELPFSEVLDWSKFSLNIDENHLLQIPNIIRSISDDEVLTKKQQALFIYSTYFSSIEKIIHTTFEVLHGRISTDMQKSHLMWNKPPGALSIDLQFSKYSARFPSYYTLINTRPIKKFTAVILALSAVYRSSSPLFNLIKSINLSLFLDQILVIWLPNTSIPEKSKWPRTKVTLRLIHPPKKTMNARYINVAGLIKTDAVFSFDEDVIINTSEIDFAFSVWHSNPSRLVGFSTETHYLDSSSDQPRWRYTSKLMNKFSMIHTSSAIFHKYYSYLYTMKPPPGLHELVEREQTCESMAMNFLISQLANQPPIKVCRSSQFKDGATAKADLHTERTPGEYFEVNERCFEELMKIYGGLPLKYSKVMMNPVLYKDPVSISRKKYRTLE